MHFAARRAAAPVWIAAAPEWYGAWSRAGSARRMAGYTRCFRLFISLERTDARRRCASLVIGAGVTFVRVEASLAIAALWTIPAGVAIGFNPKLARIAQPIAQVAASVPATALFPVLLLALISLGGGLGTRRRSC